MYIFICNRQCFSWYIFCWIRLIQLNRLQKLKILNVMPTNWGFTIFKMKLMLGLYGYQVCFQYLPKASLVLDMKTWTLLELHDYHPNNLRKKCTEFCGLGLVSTDVNIGLQIWPKCRDIKKIVSIIWNVSLYCWTAVHSGKVFLNGPIRLQQTWIGYWQLVSIQMYSRIFR